MVNQNIKRLAFFLSLPVLAISVALLFPGCREKEKSRLEKPVFLRVSGSGTTIPLLKILGEAYTKENPEVLFEFLPSTHTIGGVNGVATGDLDIGGLARTLTPEEKSLGLNEIWIAKDPIVFLVHNEIGVTELTTDQIKKIYRGEITNWNQVGGIDRAIAVIDRPEHASAKIVLRETLFGKDLAVTSQAVVVERADDVAPALNVTPNGIVYTSHGKYRSQNLDFAVIRINGIYPDKDIVKKGAYPWYRPLGVVTAAQPPGTVQGFLDFVFSDRGRSITADNYYFFWE